MNVPTAAPLARQLDILTENAGRVNFAQLDNNHVGLGDTPYYSGQKLKSWDIYPLPMDQNFIEKVSNVTVASSDNVV